VVQSPLAAKPWGLEDLNYAEVQKRKGINDNQTPALRQQFTPNFAVPFGPLRLLCVIRAYNQVTDPLLVEDKACSYHAFARIEAFSNRPHMH
jgi:hypothetical protein